MKNINYKKYLVIVIVILFIGASVIPSMSVDINKSSHITDVNNIESENAIETFSSVPLFFTENKGQFPEEVMFQTHVSGATVYLCQDRVVTVFSDMVDEESSDLDYLNKDSKSSDSDMLSVVTKIVDPNPDATIHGEGILPHYNNYFIGNDPDKWYTRVPNYESVCYRDIYPGIDLRYYGDGCSLKYEFIVYPGADPSVIKLRYEGIESLEVTPTGELEAVTRFGSIYEGKPFIYQEINGGQQNVPGLYEIRGTEVFGFLISDSYDPSYILVIDPILCFSTFHGGSQQEEGWGVAVETSFHTDIYVTGWTYSTVFPGCVNLHSGGKDVFVSAFGQNGGLIWSTYVGGENDDVGRAIDLYENEYPDPNDLYITGWTNSSVFPCLNPYQDYLDGSRDAFVTKLDDDGFLIYSSYLGGNLSEEGWDIACGPNLEGEICAYVTGWTNSYDFDLQNPIYSYIGKRDVFVTQFSPDGTSLSFSTCLGDQNYDVGYGIDVYEESIVYVTGWTSSNGFPTTLFTLSPSYNGGTGDAFISRIDTDTPFLDYSTFLGGINDERCLDIVAYNGSIYVTGNTSSSDFPVNALWTIHEGNTDAFVTVLSDDLSTLLKSAFIGGKNDEEGWGVAVSEDKDVYVTGITFSDERSFALVLPLDWIYNGNGDVFVTKLDPYFHCYYSTYLDTAEKVPAEEDWGRDIALGFPCVGEDESAVITGHTYSENFPIKNAYDPVYNLNGDAFLTKIGHNHLPGLAVILPSHVGIHRKNFWRVQVRDDEEDNCSFMVDFGDGSSSGWMGPYTSGKEIIVEHTWMDTGTYIVKAKTKDDYGESNWSEVSSVLVTEKCLYIGFIANHSSDEYLATFDAKGLIFLSSNPVNFKLYKSDEQVTIPKYYKGIIFEPFILVSF